MEFVALCYMFRWSSFVKGTTSFSFVGPTERYRISVKTGDVIGAGTDANVYVYICGSKRESGRCLKMTF